MGFPLSHIVHAVNLLYGFLLVVHDDGCVGSAAAASEDNVIQRAQISISQDNTLNMTFMARKDELGLSPDFTSAGIDNRLKPLVTRNSDNITLTIGRSALTVALQNVTLLSVLNVILQGMSRFYEV